MMMRVGLRSMSVAVVWLVSALFISSVQLFSYAFVTPHISTRIQVSISGNDGVEKAPPFTGRQTNMMTWPRTKQQQQPLLLSSSRQSPFQLYSIPSNKEEDVNFSRKVRLREEAESPFRKVRYFFYLVAAGGCFTSLAISIARIAAAVSGINTDLNESLVNGGIDIVVLAAVAYFFKNDQEAEQSRLKRASKGAAIAKLNVRVSKRLLNGDIDSDDTGSFMTSLASLRRGRGIEKRVAIVAAGQDKINQVLSDVQELDDDLDVNDLLIVPFVLPNIDTIGGLGDGSESSPPKSLAVPVVVGDGVGGWKDFIEEEVDEAKRQGVDVQQEGLCVILKKNGRVGQRTKGISLSNLVGNIVSRREAGMDVTNI